METTFHRALAAHMRNSEPSRTFEHRPAFRRRLLVGMAWLAGALAAGVALAYAVAHGLRWAML